MVIEICYNDLLGSIFPFCFFSPHLSLSEYLTPFKTRTAQWRGGKGGSAFGRYHAKACITHHPSTHSQECSSSISQLFPLTQMLSTAPQLLFQKDKLLIDKVGCHFISSKINTTVVLNAASNYSDACTYSQLLGITLKPSSAPGQLPAEYLTMPVLYPGAEMQRALRPRSIVSGHKFLLTLQLVFSIRSDLEKK